MRGAHDDHARPGVGERGQGPAARQRLVVGMREDGEHHLPVKSRSGGRQHQRPCRCATIVETPHVAVHHRQHAEALDRRGAHAPPVHGHHRISPFARSSRSSKTPPVTPSSTISRTAPLFSAATGVPQAIASVSTSPKGSPA